jgi:hypothetical protein
VSGAVAHIFINGQPHLDSIAVAPDWSHFSFESLASIADQIRIRFEVHPNSDEKSEPIDPRDLGIAFRSLNLSKSGSRE